MKRTYTYTVDNHDGGDNKASDNGHGDGHDGVDSGGDDGDADDDAVDGDGDTCLPESAQSPNHACLIHLEHDGIDLPPGQPRQSGKRQKGDELG